MKEYRFEVERIRGVDGMKGKASLVGEWRRAVEGISAGQQSSSRMRWLVDFGFRWVWDWLWLCVVHY
jgi:hypothetical protein